MYSNLTRGWRVRERFAELPSVHVISGGIDEVGEETWRGEQETSLGGDVHFRPSHSETEGSAGQAGSLAIRGVHHTWLRLELEVGRHVVGEYCEGVCTGNYKYKSHYLKV